MSALVTLSQTYHHSITQARRVLAANRTRGGYERIFLSAPITAPLIEVAVDRKSLYVLGFREVAEHRGAGKGPWWEFEPDGTLPRLEAPSRIIRSGPASYSNLGLEAGTEVVLEPWHLLNNLAAFDGVMGDAARKRQLLLLIFLVAEALRFDSVKAACHRYAANNEAWFELSDFYRANPTHPLRPYRLTEGHLSGHRFAFTDALVETVKNWRTRTEAGSYDVALPWIA